MTKRSLYQACAKAQFLHCEWRDSLVRYCKGSEIYLSSELIHTRDKNGLLCIVNTLISQLEHLRDCVELDYLNK